MLHTQIFEPFSPGNTELMVAAQQSVYGVALARQIRYERYCYIEEGVAHLELGPARRDEVHQTWTREILDADVDNLHHNTYTALLGQAICDTEAVDHETKGLVVRSLLVHDLKEAVLDVSVHEGDITYDEAVRRGQASHMAEHAELGDILRQEPHLFGLSEEQVSEVEHALNDSKEHPPRTEAGQLIEITERIGYMHSALRACHVATAEASLHGRQREMFFWMAENVFGNQLSRLIELAPNRPSVRTFLDERAEDISLVFAYLMEPWTTRVVAELYLTEGKDDPAKRRAMRDTALQKWLDYLDTSLAAAS